MGFLVLFVTIRGSQNMGNLQQCGTLYEVAAAINSSLDPAGVLEAIVRKAAEAMDVKGCSIMLLTPDRKELRHSAHYGISEGFVRKGPVRMDPHLMEPLEGRSVTVLDASRDSRIQYPEETRREGIVSMLSVPIQLRGEVIGVLRLYTSEPRDFDPDEIEFVEAVANLGAIAMENASRFAESQVDLESLRSYIYRYAGT
jgi:GAF domain-containing protein